MSWRYSGLTLILILALLVAHAGLVCKRAENIPPTWLSPPPLDDPESRLAMGEKLPLECADISNLELIKGISDTLAHELLEKRYEIMRAALKGPHMEAIKRARGVGEKTAERLLTYLDLTAPCSITERYEVWEAPQASISLARRKGARTRP